MSQTTTCRTCGASLAPDQRYCLSCGTRVTAPRLDFVAEMEQANANGTARVNGHDPATAPTAVQAGMEGVAPGTAAPAPAPAPSRLDRVGGPMGAAAVVLVALGIGFLIGQAGNDTPVAQRAPVVNIQGGGLPSGAAAPTTTDTTATDPAVTDGSSSDTGSTSDSASRRSATRRAAEDAARVEESTRDIPKVDTEGTGGDLNRLRQLPDEVATPGAPPPRDNREAGGGTEAETIG